MTVVGPLVVFVENFELLELAVSGEQHVQGLYELVVWFLRVACLCVPFVNGHVEHRAHHFRVLFQAAVEFFRGIDFDKNAMLGVATWS